MPAASESSRVVCNLENFLNTEVISANFSSASGFRASSICASERVLSSSSSSTTRLVRRSVSSASSSFSPSADSSSSTSSSSLNDGPAVFSLISPSSSSSSSRFSGTGSLESMASRSRISRNCISPSLSAVDHSMMALNVVGLSHRPQIMVSRPASIRLAMAISPSRLSNSTAPISRRYMRTGSSVRSAAAFFGTAAEDFFSLSLPSIDSTSSPPSSSATSSSFSTIRTPISEMADMTSSICSFWSWGKASFSSSIVR